MTAKAAVGLFLIISCLFHLSVAQARETWRWNKIEGHEAFAMVGTRFGGPIGRYGSKADVLLLNFDVNLKCIPTIQIITQKETSDLQLRVDQRSVYRPAFSRWLADEPARVFTYFLEPKDTDGQLSKQRLRELQTLIFDLKAGNSVTAKLEPSGEVLHWGLKNSRRAIEEAAWHCRKGLKEHHSFLE